MEDGLDYTVSVSNISGYTAPAPVSGVSSAESVSRNITMTYQKVEGVNYLSNKTDFDGLMDWMDDNIVAEEPVGQVYPTNFTQAIVNDWNNGFTSGSSFAISADTSEDVNVIAVAIPSGKTLNSIVDSNQSQEILSMFYVQNVNYVVNGITYTKIYSRTMEGGIGTFSYLFNVVSE